MSGFPCRPGLAFELRRCRTAEHYHADDDSSRYVITYSVSQADFDYSMQQIGVELNLQQ